MTESANGISVQAPIHGIPIRNAIPSAPYMIARGFASRRSMSSSRSRWSGVGHSQVPASAIYRGYRHARPSAPAATPFSGRREQARR